MRWINHSITTFCVTTVVTANPVLGMAAAAGSAVPDKIEIVLPFIRHRGASHDIMYWAPVLVVLLAWAFLPFNLFPSFLPAGVPKLLAVGITVGVLMHLFTDGLSKSGVPVFRKHRFAANLYKTFTLSEYVTVLAICAPCLTVGWMLGRFSADISNMTKYLAL